MLFFREASQAPLMRGWYWSTAGTPGGRGEVGPGWTFGACSTCPPRGCTALAGYQAPVGPWHPPVSSKGAVALGLSREWGTSPRSLE